MYGRLVLDARRARGLSQVQLADISGIDQPNISAIESGRREPTASTLHRLLHACGLELGATDGERLSTYPPPAGDEFFDSLLEHRGSGDAVVTRRTPMATRVRVITAVLDAAEAVVRGR